MYAIKSEAHRVDCGTIPPVYLYGSRGTDINAPVARQSFCDSRMSYIVIIIVWAWRVTTTFGFRFLFKWLRSKWIQLSRRACKLYSCKLITSYSVMMIILRLKVMVYGRRGGIIIAFHMCLPYNKNIRCNCYKHVYNIIIRPTFMFYPNQCGVITFMRVDVPVRCRNSKYVLSAN